MKRIIYRPVNSFIIWKISLMLFEKYKATNYWRSRTGSSRSWGKRGGGSTTTHSNKTIIQMELSRSIRTYWSTAKNIVNLDHSWGYTNKNQGCYVEFVTDKNISLTKSCRLFLRQLLVVTTFSFPETSTWRCFRSACSLELTNTKQKPVYDFTCICCIDKESKTHNCENVWWGSFHVQINNNINMQRWHPEKHDSEERWPVSGLNQDESQEIWFNECPTIIRHFETVRGFGTKITTSCWYTSWYIHHILQWPIIMAERMRFNFITFCKKEQVYISALTFILP